MYSAIGNMITWRAVCQTARQALSSGGRPSILDMHRCKLIFASAAVSIMLMKPRCGSCPALLLAFEQVGLGAMILIFCAQVSSITLLN